MKAALISVFVAPVLMFVTMVALMFASAPVVLFSPASLITTGVGLVTGGNLADAPPPTTPPGGGGPVGPVKWDGTPSLVLPGGGTNGLPAGFALPAGTPSRVVIVLDYAASKLGLPYQWGGVGNPSYDCSGLMMKAWEAAGISIDRGSNDQSHDGVPENMSTIKPGDMVFTPGSDGTMALPGHVGIYLGKGLILQAPHTGAYINAGPLDDSHFGPISGIRRVDTVEPWPVTA